MILRLLASLCIISSLSGCELVASFDRNKIPPPKLMRPDASLVTPVPDTDSGVLDASTGDASVSEGGLADGAVLDGSAPNDAAIDGALPEAGAP